MMERDNAPDWVQELLDSMLHMVAYETVYHVTLYGNGSVKVGTFGMINPDISVLGIHPSVESLPVWMQEKLAVLHMFTPGPEARVDGVGRRIHERIFWVCMTY